jgi:hypothetical protein
MSSRWSDPQRLVERIADQMYRETTRSRNGRPATRRATELPPTVLSPKVRRGARVTRVPRPAPC